MEADQLDGLSPERPPYLGLLVPLGIVGKAIAFVQHVQGHFGGRARDQEGQWLFGIVSRLVREDGERTLQGVQVRRRGLETLPGPSRYVGPHQKAGTRLPGGLRGDRVVADARDRRRAVEDRDLASEPFQRAQRVEVGRRRECFESHVSGEVVGKDVPLRAQPADTLAAVEGRVHAQRRLPGDDQRAPAGGGWKPKRLRTARPWGLAKRSRNAWASAGCFEAATTAPG